MAVPDLFWDDEFWFSTFGNQHIHADSLEDMPIVRSRIMILYDEEEDGYIRVVRKRIRFTHDQLLFLQIHPSTKIITTYADEETWWNQKPKRYYRACFS